MSKIFIMQEQDKFNYMPAAKWGDVRFLTSARFNPLSPRATEVIAECIENLKEFDPARDYLIPTGSPTLIGVISAHVLCRHGACRFLQWDNMNREYAEFKWSQK